MALTSAGRNTTPGAKVLFIFAALTVLVGMMALPLTAAPTMQGPNLLQNPSFEDGTQGWSPWY